MPSQKTNGRLWSDLSDSDVDDSLDSCAPSSIPASEELAKSTSSTESVASSTRSLPLPDVSGADVALLARTLRDHEGLWSKGSYQHAKGKCKACHYLRSKKGCTQGPSCTFCHVPHTNSINTKVGSVKREVCEKIVEAVRVMHVADPSSFERLKGLVSSRSTLLAEMFTLQSRDLTRKADFDAIFAEQSSVTNTSSPTVLWSNTDNAEVQAMLVRVPEGPIDAASSSSHTASDVPRQGVIVGGGNTTNRRNIVSL